MAEKKIAVCDDEKMIADELADMIKGYVRENELGSKIVVDTYYSAFALDDAVDTGTVYDLIFMDIVLQKENGIRLSQSIVSKMHNTKIVFITGYIELVEDIFYIEPFALLMKPIKQEKVCHIIEKALEMIEKEKKSYIALKTVEGTYKIDITRLATIESEKKYVVLTEAGGKQYRTIMTMDEVGKLVGNHLERCHRSYYVNLDMVRQISDKKALLTDGREIPISRNLYQEIYHKFMDKLAAVVE